MILQFSLTALLALQGPVADMQRRNAGRVASICYTGWPCPPEFPMLMRPCNT